MHPFEFDCVEVCERSWSPTAELQALAEMDIGLMPLDNTPWSRGKCAYKALQYMALGIPTVAQRVGANLGIIEHGVNGLLAGSMDEWLCCIRSLLC